MLIFTICPYHISGEEKGSITITIISQDDINGTRVDTPLPDVVFDVYQVWKYDGFDIVFNDPFKDAALISSDMSEDQIQKTVDKFYAKIGDATVYTVTDPTNANGVSVLRDLEKGCYLFVQKGEIEYKERKYRVMPFMVTVPRQIDGKFVLDVSAFPKLRIRRFEKPPIPETGID